ncbi:MAG: 30S ribosomal protein S20 [Patescibacteria group bacterium]|nr:30S ribosomal protein S20 [Patescibacteria group bacterium]
MPIIKSALKKMRQDRKKTAINRLRKEKVKKLTDKAVKNPTKENISLAISAVDKLIKVKVIHGNKAARIKSRLAKLAKKDKAAAKEGTIKKTRLPTKSKK